MLYFHIFGDESLVADPNGETYTVRDVPELRTDHGRIAGSYRAILL